LARTPTKDEIEEIIDFKTKEVTLKNQSIEVKVFDTAG